MPSEPVIRMILASEGLTEVALLSEPTVISQSSDSARSVMPAWPARVISYVCGRIKIMPCRVQVQVAASVPGGRMPRHHPPQGEAGRGAWPALEPRPAIGK